MKSRLASTIRLAALALLAVGLSGFGPGGCGPVPNDPPEPRPCVGLDEQTCLADSACQPRFDSSRCACAPCPPTGPCPPCRCGDYLGCELKPVLPPPPPACSGLDESACLARPDCIGIYDGGTAPTRCDEAKEPGCDTPVASVFVRCEPAVCPAVMCFLYCPNGMKHDGRGCPICECNDGCLSDADCPPDAFCSIPELVCSPGTTCPKPTGVCEKRPVPGPTCVTNADCLPGQYCEFSASCMSLDCPPPPMNGFCRNMDCAADGECPPGSSCMAEPLCSGAGCPQTKPAVRVSCQADCSFLDENACANRPDCRAVYGTACDANGNCTPDRTFHCEKASTCGDVMCELYCEFGFQIGANGCPICACNPPPPGRCASDADCAIGEYCDRSADPNTAGTCTAMPTGCTTDTDCAIGQVCWIKCGTPPVSGICRDATCASDADCSPGQVCRPDPKDPCNGTAMQCFRAGAQICQSPCAGLDESACGARYDCRAVYAPDASATMKFNRCE